MVELSAYELKRAETIKQNKAVLAELDIKPLDIKKEGGLSTPSKERSKTKLKAPIPLAERRLSRRIRNDNSELPEEPLSSFPKEVKRVKNPNSTPRAGALPLTSERGENSTLFLYLLEQIKNSSSSMKEKEKKEKKEKKCFSINSPNSMCRMTEDRIYSMSINPSISKILISAGSKYGNLGFWDATDAYENRSSFDKIDNTAACDDQQSKDETLSSYSRKSWIFSPVKEAISCQKYINDRELIFSSYDGKVSLMDLSNFSNESVRTIYQENGRDIAMMDIYNPNTIFITDMDGWTSPIDLRSSTVSVPRYRLHLKKAGGLSIKGNYLASSSLDRSVSLWDIRTLKGSDGGCDILSLPISQFHYNRAVTSLSFQEDSFVERLALTCYDDTLRIISDPLKGGMDNGSSEIVIPHNNQTGRWISIFKCIWNRHSQVIIGDMNRSLDLINGISGEIQQFNSPLLTAQPASNALHPSLDIMASGTATGRTFLWT